MKLSQAGKIAQKHWQEIPQHFVGVYIDEYVVMPNHVHGIVIISNSRRDVACCGETPRRRKAQGNAHQDTSLPTMMISTQPCPNYRPNLVR